MGRPTIRVSEWALGELRKRSVEEGRSVVALIDRLLGRPLVPTSFAPGIVGDAGAMTELRVGSKRGSRTVVFEPPIEVKVGDDVGALVAARCPKCGCPRSVHEAGASKERCERHPSCRWTP